MNLLTWKCQRLLHLKSEEDMVLDLLLSLRTGFWNSVSGDSYPVCHEKLETEAYEEYATSFWDDITGKPLRADLVRASQKEEVDTIRSMGVWEVVPRPANEKVIPTR